tara:strand:+ start:474 stop:788 length:315 start_codon:yes stop_codon:yes gene_type:complete
MAWSRTKVSGVSGTGKIDPDNTSNIKFVAANISDIPISISTANKKAYPGALTLPDFTDMFFTGSIIEIPDSSPSANGIGDFDSGTSFALDARISWFRDSGSTTT